ncbi:hypothetical protein GC170_02620 [bacterium]|nr:hypothetical protein [bacterium]
MPQRLVTVRSYFDPLDAEMAVNLLRSEGVEATLADAKLVSNTWHLANAVQGIKLQVPEQDLNKASYYLGEIDSARSERLSENRAEFAASFEHDGTDDEDDDEEADYADESDDDFDETESDHILPWTGGYAATADSDDLEDPPNRAEANADRAFKGAAFGLIFIPLQFYVTLLLARVYFGGENLRPRYRRRAILAAVVNMTFLVLMMFAFLLPYYLLRS